MSNKILQNTSNLQDILEVVNNLPDAGGVELPELTNEGTASDLLLNKELIDQEGNVVTGTFTIDNELTTQNDLISQIQTALESKASAEPALQEKTVTPSTSSQAITPDSGYDGLSKVTVNGDANLVAENIAEGVSIFGVNGTHSGSEDLDTELTEQEGLISQLSGILDNKASGGSGGGNVETCTVTITVSMGIIVLVGYNALINEQVQAKAINNDNNTITLENVICESVIGIYWSTVPVELGATISNGGEVLSSYNYYHILKAPSIGNLNTTFYLYDND